MENRKPAVAGSFYSEDPLILQKEIATLYKKGVNNRVGNAKVIIAPHAGYIFSGKIAASAIKQINPENKYKRIFILASSHQQFFPGVSIYAAGHYELPLGTAHVDLELVHSLIEKNNFINYIQSVHRDEHCIEVEIPLLQYHLKHEFLIVPIIIGGQDKNTPSELAQVLEPFFNEENIFLISTDFSHYLDYDTARKIDNETAAAVCSGNPDIFRKTLENHKSIAQPGVSTDICGATAVETMLTITQKKNISYKIIDYQNSGDTIHGSKKRVVGYYAIAGY